MLGGVEPLLAPSRRRRALEPLLAPCRRRRARRAAMTMSDAAQPVLWGENLVKSHDGARRQLDDASLVLREGQRCCVVGHNGCGKSTLLEIISGSDRPDGGGVRLKRGVKVTAVPQEPLVAPEDATKTVRDVLLGGDGAGVEAARAYAAAAAAYEAKPDDVKVAKSFERAADAMNLHDGWAVEAAVATAAAKLNVEHLQDRRVADLSGGERKRVSLAGALLSGGDILVLDEPTNHLDLWAVRWLEDLLIGDELSSKTLLFVSHDRTFSETVATSIVELDGGALYEHSTAQGSLVEAYLQGKATRLADARSQASSTRKQLEVELAWLARGAKARQSKAVNRIARVEVLKKGAAEVEGRGDLGLASGAARGDAGRRDETRRKRVVVTVDGLGAAYGDEVIFEDFSYEIAHNDRIAVVGANGAGKSTLVRAVVAAAAREGKLIGCTDAERNALVEHDEDDTITLATVTVGYYAQTPLDAHDETSPMDYAVDVVSRRPDAARAASDVLAAAASLLKSYQIDGASWQAPLARLSGGERRRLQLMAVLDANPDILVLDEPSNDLDLGALQSLERFLTNDFRGALLLVSHDRSLVDATCDKLLVLPGDGYVSSFAGSMSEYLEIIDADDDGWEEEIDVDEAAAEAAARADRRAADDARRAAHNAPKKIKMLEPKIEEKEAAIVELDAELTRASADVEKVQNLFAEKTALQAEVDAMYAEWEELEALVAAANVT
jgi:ATP-binding cassette subfamily F protein uup